ncbi:MAG: ABC transporter permease [Rhodoferax sp.]|nr:ABC transporter permease [Rhodoferax sp.]
MPASLTLPTAPRRLVATLLRALRSWAFMLHFGALVLVLLLSPSSYTHTYRAATAQRLVVSTWLVLPWFTALSSLLSLVLIRIVVVTALSYGLSQYALQMVVRVLVLELIPLSAALFVALRAGLAFNAGALPDGASARVQRVRELDLAQLHRNLLPRVLADGFSVLALAMFSGVITLVLAYLVVYGLSPWGLPGFTRTVGQVFDLTMSLGFLLKVLLFSLAVAVVPMAASLDAHWRASSATIQPGAVRLLVVLLIIEAALLVVNYI